MQQQQQPTIEQIFILLQCINRLSLPSRWFLPVFAIRSEIDPTPGQTHNGTSYLVLYSFAVGITRKVIFYYSIFTKRKTTIKYFRGIYCIIGQFRWYSRFFWYIQIYAWKWKWDNLTEVVSYVAFIAICVLFLNLKSHYFR